MLQLRNASSEFPAQLLQAGHGVSAGVQDRRDVTQAEAEFLEGKNLLQSQQLRLGVEPIAIARNSHRLQQTDRVVVPQGAAGDASAAGYLSNGPLHCYPFFRPNARC